MIETAEQIQSPVTPEPSVVEVPAPSLTEVPAQTPASETTLPDGALQDEVALTAEIAQLWQIHNDFKSVLRQQSQNLHSLRVELGKKLAEMKALLATPGRAGKWSSWLKEQKIARSTADRLVAKHELLLHPDPNCPTDSIRDATDEELQALLDKVTPRLRKALPTPASAYKFIEMLVSSLALDHQGGEQGILILKPVQQTAAVEPVPAEAQHEPVESPANPVPSTADVPVETHSESAAASMAL
jgi:hypothetical protein